MRDLRKLERWVLDHGPFVIPKEEISQVLFHRGRMLLLDKVTISAGTAVGEFTVIAENCDGHEPIPGTPVFRGVDVIEMAFQLLGIIVYKNPGLTELRDGRFFVAREVAGAKFSKPILVGDHLVLTTSTETYIEHISETLKIGSSLMFVRVGTEKRGSIASVSIAGFKAKK